MLSSNNKKFVTEYYPLHEHKTAHKWKVHSESVRLKSQIKVKLCKYWVNCRDHITLEWRVQYQWICFDSWVEKYMFKNGHTLHSLSHLPSQTWSISSVPGFNYLVFPLFWFGISCTKPKMHVCIQCHFLPWSFHYKWRLMIPRHFYSLTVIMSLPLWAVIWEDG